MFRDIVDYIFSLFTNTRTKKSKVKKQNKKNKKSSDTTPKRKKKLILKKADKKTKSQTERTKSKKQRPEKGNGAENKPETKPQVETETEPKPKPQPKPQPKPVVKRPPWKPEDFKVEPVEGKVRFHDLGLSEELMQAIHETGFEFCTPIQGEILPHCIQGKDAIGQAQTGTGKTAAFLIAVFNRLQNNPAPERPVASPRALVVAPTRELVIQITRDAESIGKYLGLNMVAVFGGMDYKKQLTQFRNKEVDIVFATPGRLLDFSKNKALNLSRVEILVIDEADRMLDMGFIPDMRKIVLSTPNKKDRHTMLFSATFSTAVMRLAASWTRDAVEINIEPESVAVKTVDQKTFLATDEEKMIILYNLLTKRKLDKVIVFANRRDVCKKIDEELYRHGIETQLISGDIAQNKRIRTLQDFKDGKIQVLVATDVASRGLHIDGVTHVINYSLPEDAEDYVHRIGRTGRAGAEGTSVSFASEADSFFIPAIEKYIGNTFEYDYPDEELLTPLPEYVREKPKQDPQKITPGSRKYNARKRHFDMKRGGNQGNRRRPNSSRGGGNNPNRGGSQNKGGNQGNKPAGDSGNS